MKLYQIVIDTNVLLAALLSKRGASYKLLSMLNDARWQLNVSTALMLEYEEVLKRERVQLGLSLADIDDLLDGLCAIANRLDIFYQWRPVSRDPDDDFLVDLAVRAQADFIITYLDFGKFKNGYSKVRTSYKTFWRCYRNTRHEFRG